MADTELTQVEPKAATLLVTCSDTVFAKGNRLVDPVLLKQLQNTAPLTPIQAANLALFLNSNPTNRCLAEHIATFALIATVTDPRLQKSILEVVPYDWNDFWEDFFDGASDEPNIKRPTLPSTSQTQPLKPQLFALSLFSSLALLVESHVDEEKISYFVIGVSPDPATIPLQ